MQPPKGMEDAFGFGSVRSSVKDRIRQIKPTVPVAAPADLARVDAIADNAGFVSREGQQETSMAPYRVLRNRRPEPRMALNMRAPVRLGAAFQRFSDENRYSYPEALEEIMRRAGVLP